MNANAAKFYPHKDLLLFDVVLKPNFYISLLYFYHKFVQSQTKLKDSYQGTVAPFAKRITKEAMALYFDFHY